MASFATPIKAVSGGATEGHPEIRRLAEESAQTELRGTPVVADADLMYEASAAITDATSVLLAGFTSEPFHNLTTQDTAKHLSAGAPQNQPSATIIPLGAPLSDGKIGVIIANGDTLFEGAFGTTDVATLPAAADVGKIYGLTKDTGNSYWYVDKAKTTLGAGAIVTIVALHPQDVIDGLVAGSRVIFRVNQVNRLFEQ